MTTKKRQRISLEEFMATSSPNGQRCATCAYDHKAFHADVEKMAKALSAGTCKATRAALYEWARAEYPGYESSLSSFRQHLKRCLGVPPASEMVRRK